MPAGDPLPAWGLHVLGARAVARWLGPLAPLPGPACVRCGAPLAELHLPVVDGATIPVAACEACWPIVDRLCRLTSAELRELLGHAVAP